ncbi:hypothetical protein MYP_1662 [Sporocytophaga myxococcoides]|uniref:Uncharacterized protein n=1 Tax=Sporocytophaga myxococcoides TaxID=153721 RepID=A0A098LDD2_9BACT|nr:hypothetical protein MYP_1662 [Sporocytophaga myxococcoides]
MSLISGKYSPICRDASSSDSCLLIAKYFNNGSTIQVKNAREPEIRYVKKNITLTVWLNFP